MRSQSVFLRGVAAIFLIAFASVLVQIPGLYSTHGLQPVAAFLEQTGGKSTLHPLSSSFWSTVMRMPSVLWLHQLVGASPAATLRQA